MAGQNAASQSVTATILTQVDALFATPLPEDVIEWARQGVLDWLGVALAGAEDELTLALRDEAREEGGRPVATVLYHGDKTSPMLAALVNASMADALDFSDANPNMHGHTTPAIVAAALALAETKDASGRVLLEAIVAGIEAACRVGLLAHGWLHPGGFHPTGTTVVFGAAAAAAHLLGLDSQATRARVGSRGDPGCRARRLGRLDGEAFPFRQGGDERAAWRRASLRAASPGVSMRSRRPVASSRRM